MSSSKVQQGAQSYFHEVQTHLQTVPRIFSPLNRIEKCLEEKPTFIRKTRTSPVFDFPTERVVVRFPIGPSLFEPTHHVCAHVEPCVRHRELEHNNFRDERSVPLPIMSAPSAKVAAERL